MRESTERMIMHGTRWEKEDIRPFEEDGELWWLIDCRYEVGDWLDKQGPTLARTYGPYHQSRYKVNEKLLPILILKYGCPKK